MCLFKTAIDFAGASCGTIAKKRSKGFLLVKNKQQFNSIVIAFKAAFPKTLPVLAGFSFLGIAFGILMKTKGYGFGWSVLMSIIVFAGSAQFAAINYLTTIFNPVYAFLMTLMINARHLFYGISLLDKYKDMGKIKPYLIFGLCDETFSIVCSEEPPEDVDRKWFYFSITFLDHFYWVLGTAVGALIGSVISFNTKGLDFVSTALFVVIFVEQWKSQKSHVPAITGLVCSAVCLLIFGPEDFIIPSMFLIILVLSVLKNKLDVEEDKA